MPHKLSTQDLHAQDIAMHVQILTTSLKYCSSSACGVASKSSRCLASEHAQADTNAQAAASSALSLQSLKCKARHRQACWCRQVQEALEKAQAQAIEQAAACSTGPAELTVGKAMEASKEAAAQLAAQGISQQAGPDPADGPSR